MRDILVQGVALFVFIAFCASLFVKLTLKLKCTFKIEVQERRSLFAKTNIELKVLRINGKVLYLQNQKLVPMKKEIGKWLMDIAKYLTTAILLSSLFSDIKNWPWYFYLLMVCSIISVLYGGLVLMEPPKEKNRNKHQSKRKK